MVAVCCWWWRDRFAGSRPGHWQRCPVLGIITIHHGSMVYEYAVMLSLETSLGHEAVSRPTFQFLVVVVVLVFVLWAQVLVLNLEVSNRPISRPQELWSIQMSNQIMTSSLWLSVRRQFRCLQIVHLVTIVCYKYYKPIPNLHHESPAGLRIKLTNLRFWSWSGKLRSWSCTRVLGLGLVHSLGLGHVWRGFVNISSNTQSFE